MADIKEQLDDHAETLRQASQILTVLITSRNQETYDPKLVIDYLRMCPHPEDTLEMLMRYPPRVVSDNGEIIEPHFEPSPATEFEKMYADQDLVPDTDLVPPQWRTHANEYFKDLKKYLRTERLADGLSHNQRSFWKTEVLNVLRAIDMQQIGLEQDAVRSHFLKVKDFLLTNKYTGNTMHRVKSMGEDLLMIVENTHESDFVSEGDERRLIRQARANQFNIDSPHLESALRALHQKLTPQDGETGSYYELHPETAEEVTTQVVDLAIQILTTFGKMGSSISK